MSSHRPTITVVGLGPGDPDLLTLAAARLLSEADEVWIRTAGHPSRSAIPAACRVRACDDLYAAHATFDAVYHGIAERLIGAAGERDVIYGVPGDPTFGETSVGLLRRMAAEVGVACRIVPGIAFVGPTLAALGWDALDGLQIADATELAARHHPDIDPERPALVAQIHSALVASQVKLCLLARYPAEHPVTLVGGAGEVAGATMSSAGQGLEERADEEGGDASDASPSGAASGPGGRGEAEGGGGEWDRPAAGPSAATRLLTLPLCDLDRDGIFDDVTTLAVPPLPRGSSTLGLAEVIARLRAPDGCPWDREQSHESLRPYAIEEAYEVVEAIDAEDAGALAEELGDLLLQVVLHAQIAAEAGEFTLTEVIRGIHDKLVRRHPHVFGDAEAETSEAVRARWAELKAEEKRESGAEPASGVPRALPALARAQALMRRAPGVRSPTEPGLIGALAAAVAGAAHRDRAGGGPAAHAPDEVSAAGLGDALWALVRLADETGIDAETALRDAGSRFEAAIRPDGQHTGGRT